MFNMALPPLPSDDLDHVLERTRDLWEEARGSSFFITGGTGFFGVWLLETFCRANDHLALEMQAAVLTRAPSKFAVKCPHLARRPDLKFHTGDISDFAFPPGKYSYLIHAATDANARQNAENPAGTLTTIVDGTRHLLAFAAGCGARKLLLTSSGAVYGRQPPSMPGVAEDYAGAPDPLVESSAYGEGKRMAEHLCAVHSATHGYEAKIARCFAFVGPHLPLDRGFAIGNFIRDALNGNPIHIQGDGSPVRSYLYAADLAIWLWMILFKGQSARAYNVGSERETNIRAAAEAISDQLSPPAAIKVSGKPYADELPERYLPSTARAQRELGLKQILNLPEAVHRTLAWQQKANPPADSSP
jgi:dTDP-glucose 4,6-dehydratase